MTWSDNPQPLTVLIVEPHETIRSMIASTAKKLAPSVTVVQSSNGVDAREKLNYNDIQLIISEWKLPKLDGISLLQYVRSNPRTAQIPFVMTSATIDQGNVMQAIQCGVSEYIVKPFSSQILLSRLQRALSKPVRPMKAEATEQTEQKEHITQVLVVDDVADNIKVISDILRKDYKVKAALNGKKALQICAMEPQPDLVLLDIMMPDMDGIEVCKRLKADPNTQHITVIFLSALEQTEHIVKGLELGAVDYITKPANPSIVRSRVKAHCRAIDSNRLMRAQIDTMMENAKLRDQFDTVNQQEVVNPIKEIQTASNALSTHLNDPQKAQQYLDFIQQNCQQLQLHLDNMQALQKIERNEYSYNPSSLSVHSILDKVILGLSHIISKQQIKIANTVPDGLQVKAEQSLLFAVFTHLLQNALEASSKDKAVTVSAQSDNQFHTIEIHNSDVIAQPIRQNFLDKFVSHGKGTRSGLGTYTAKLLTEQQKGYIEYRSDEQSGTSVFVSIPMA
ncbi:response regulator [Pseudoalteromonas luteoviolacea]|uniref:response regulator n=1 Tax=Pseudoalteromonas luteoviolacea TaxID=43657 RepID=UPI001EEDF320|nr:response regulator [Pseudoalteromonas luteoviolacea]MCF6440004.1 response regulator [Pseudoalteromonas luteoviolacea]